MKDENVTMSQVGLKKHLKNRKLGKFNVKRLVMLFTGNNVGAAIMLALSLNGSMVYNYGQAVGYLTCLVLILAMEYDRKTNEYLRLENKELKRRAVQSIMARA